MINRQCQQCNEEFRTYFCHIKKGFGKFCSMNCRNVSYVGRKLPVEQKGKISFKVKQSWELRPKEKVIEIKCNNSQCGKIFETPIKRLVQGRGKFCSKSCTFRTGEESPLWIVDRFTLSKTQRQDNYSYKEWSKRVKNRDGWKCKMNNEECKGQLETHHILNWKDFPELRYEINNGITLCLSHHPRGREKEEKLIPTFQEIIINLNKNYCG